MRHLNVTPADVTWKSGGAELAGVSATGAISNRSQSFTSACASDYSRSTAFVAPSNRTRDPAALDRHPSGRFASFPAGPATGSLAVRRVGPRFFEADLNDVGDGEKPPGFAGTLSYSPAVGRSRATAPPDAFSSSITSAMRRRALTKSITTIFSLRDAIQSAGDTAQISIRTGGHPMSNRNKNAGREPAATRPARRPSITSPTELAVHLGRELSASAVDGNGWTDLHYAAALDWLAMARALLAAGARLDARLRADRGPLGPALVSTLSGCGQDWFRLLRRNGATPLHIAAVANASEAVGVLLEGGADPDVADATSATPLHYAAAGHSGPAAAVLAARGADVSAATTKGVTPLHAAARRDAVPVVRVLLDHGADVRAQDVGGDTPLHRAASGDAASSAALLLDRGADTAARANDGVPPLHVAALKNAGRVAQVLLDHGADVGARVNDGVTPLHVAALKDAAGIVAALLSHRADLGAEDAAGQAPLHWAAMGDAAAAAAVLIDHGAHVHARGSDGSTPLHAAAFNNAAVAVRALLERGADIHARDAARLTPLHWAAAGDGGSAAEVLLACGAGIDVRSADGSTPLREAARRQAWRSASVLLAHGADPQALDHDDATRDTESETVH